jgi:hypothetical protein
MYLDLFCKLKKCVLFATRSIVLIDCVNVYDCDTNKYLDVFCKAKEMC